MSTIDSRVDLEFEKFILSFPSRLDEIFNTAPIMMNLDHLIPWDKRPLAAELFLFIFGVQDFSRDRQCLWYHGSLMCKYPELKRDALWQFTNGRNN